MSILHRIRKIEERLNVRSEFCICEKKSKIFVIEPSAGESVREPAQKGENRKICETCGKREPEPLEATFIIQTKNQDEH